jgi:hypothetical protein
MQLPNTVQIKSMLSNGTYRVNFIKRDGTTRIMICTRDPAWLPEPVVDRYPTTCTVWDLEKAAWRCFRWDSIQSILALS